nr:MAG TPA: hypothetical protein [Caudoviricetes sp.]
MLGKAIWPSALAVGRKEKRQLLSYCRFRSKRGGKAFYSLNHNKMKAPAEK